MFSKTKFAMFALAAVVTVGAASLVSSSAEARGFGGGGFHGGGGMRMGGGHVGMGHVGIGRVGFGRVGFNRVGFNHFRPGFRRWGFNHHRWWWHHRRPILIGGGVYLGTTALATSYAAPQAAARPAPSCTCLTKQYTQEGLVVFQDVCTKEVASAPIGNSQAQLPQQPGETQQQ